MADVAVEKLVVDGWEGYAAALERPLGIQPEVLREYVLQVHLRNREPGFLIAVDE